MPRGYEPAGGSSRAAYMDALNERRAHGADLHTRRQARALGSAEADVARFQSVGVAHRVSHPVAISPLHVDAPRAKRFGPLLHPSARHTQGPTYSSNCSTRVSPVRQPTAMRFLHTASAELMQKGMPDITDSTALASCSRARSSWVWILWGTALPCHRCLPVHCQRAPKGGVPSTPLQLLPRSSPCKLWAGRWNAHQPCYPRAAVSTAVAFFGIHVQLVYHQTIAFYKRARHLAVIRVKRQAEDAKGHTGTLAMYRPRGDAQRTLRTCVHVWCGFRRATCEHATDEGAERHPPERLRMRRTPAGR